MFNKMHIRALSTLLVLTSSFTISMEQQTQEHSIDYFAEIPTELKHSIITFLTARLTTSDSFEQAIKSIKALATTNKDFNTLFQNPTITQTLIKTLSNTFNTRQCNVAAALNTKQALKWVELYLQHRSLENLKKIYFEAAMLNHVGIVALCIKTDSSIIDLNNNIETTVLEEASAVGAQDVVRYLLPFYQGKQDIKDFALTMACIYKQLELVTTLLDNGANPNAGNIIPVTTPLVIAIEKNSKELVTLLLDYGANKSSKDECNRSALDRAQKIGNQDIIDLLT
jgi:Ankyrin repeats (3 copies)